MFLSGANFALQYRVFVQRKFSALIKSDEFKLYLIREFERLKQNESYQNKINDE